MKQTLWHTPPPHKNPEVNLEDLEVLSWHGIKKYDHFYAYYKTVCMSFTPHQTKKPCNQNIKAQLWQTLSTWRFSIISSYTGVTNRFRFIKKAYILYSPYYHKQFLKKIPNTIDIVYSIWLDKRTHFMQRFSKSYTLVGKQCRSRSAGFIRSQLIWIYTVFHPQNNNI